MKTNLLTLLITFFCFVGVKNTHAQLSKKHFIPPLTYAENGNANPEDHYLYISTPNKQPVPFTIKQVGIPSGNITGLVSNTTPYNFFIGNGDSQLFVDSRQTSIVHNNKGYIIEADAAIYVSIRSIAGGGAQAGALVSKGTSALGTTFRAGMFTNEKPQDNYLNFISVMATEDNTLVTFDDLPTGILIKNYAGTLPISNILLNEGESYIVATNSFDNTINRDALIGALITSDKNIVVNIGSTNGSFSDGNGRDQGLDQIVGLDRVGKEYIFVKGDGNNGWENVLIVAHEDNTTIKINGNGVSATINKGDYHLIEGNQYNGNDNMFVETSNPVFAYQGVGANSNEANQGLFFVPPLSCENRGNVDNIPTIEKIGTSDFTGGITIVTNKNATVKINALPISNFTTSGPFNVDGNTDYVTYKVTNLTGNVSIDSSDELYCAYFNQNGAATSGSFFSGFPSAPEINFDEAVTTLGNCIPNITLNAANNELFETIEWFFYDEITKSYITTGSNNQTYTPTQPGTYILVGISCTGETYESTEVPVSICPDDYDGDGIIDNIDEDIDNDGILNCDESFGNATLDISDTNNPKIIFQDNTSNNTTTSIYTETETANLFSGTNSGNFESVITPTTDSKLKYELNFNQHINFRFTQDKTKNHTITDGEFFILKIGPNNKNVTLLDPDNQLLVDTNFDGIFESGITNISASEIHFKYAANTQGAASTFEFVANQVNQIDFKHQSNEISSTSTFNGNISITCYTLDSDGDGIENMFDLDSDNDGIPDVIETANDSDTDGVKNYLDIDSDNDGIYDLIEAGHNLPDTNEDGFIDNANTTIGINGLVDILETTPDSKILAINYTVADTDADADFNFTEVDSDNDECFDVTEAGFLGNSSGILDTFPSFKVEVDENGRVKNSNGYEVLKNDNYIISAPIIITGFENATEDLTSGAFITSTCEGATTNISIDSTADGFQWEVFNGSGWSKISDNTTYSDSDTKSLKITNTPLTHNNYFFRVTLSRTTNECTRRSEPLKLTVNPLPIINASPILQHCISENDTNPTVNLTTAENNISTTTNVTFKYFEDAAGLNEITDSTITSYPVVPNTKQVVYVSVTSANNCTTKLVELLLSIGKTPDNSFNEIQRPVCDDFLDAEGNDTVNNSDTDNISNFYLDETNIISKINPPANTTVLFYENAIDRNNSLNEIDIKNYRNNINKNDITIIPYGIQFPIYYKIVSTINNNCQGLGQFYLQINARPIASNNILTPIEQCDTGLFDGDYTNGSNKNIDLTQRIDELFQGTGQDENDFQVTYFRTAASAASGNIISSDFIGTPAAYTNLITSGFMIGDIATETVFLRILNLKNFCVNTNVSFDIIIKPLPVFTNTIPPIVVCDLGDDGDSTNGLEQNIDVSIRDTDILGARDATNFTVTYHTNKADLEDLSSTGIDKNNYNSDPSRITINTTTGISEEILFIRLLDNNTNCAFKESTLSIIVNPAPTFETISNFSECDNNEDGDDTNGIIQNIDLNDKIPEILGATQDPNNFTVTFHTDPTDVLTGSNKLEFPYQNSTATETIYVYIQNKTTLCVNHEATFQITINPLPTFTIRSPQTLCLSEGKINVFPEDFSDDYNYLWKDIDGNEINPTTSVDNIDITIPGIYNVIATTKDGTMCSRNVSFEIKPSQQITFDESFITIYDDANAINYNDNISIQIQNIDNLLSFNDYQFSLKNEDTGESFPSIGFQDEPIFDNLEGGIYTITVNDKNGCSTDTQLKISVIQFQHFMTPNGDGNNDTWTIKGINSNFYSSSSSIHIFNRFGKIVGKLPIDGRGWNGTYNGYTLPADDYWFNVLLVPVDTSKTPVQKTGHFSLLKN